MFLAGSMVGLEDVYRIAKLPWTPAHLLEQVQKAETWL